MKKSLRLAIIGVLALTAGISLANNSYTAGIKEDTKDAYENIGVSLRKANIGASETVDVSRTFVQYGSEGTRNFVRFATAISGPVKNIKYVRTVAGLDTKEKEVTTVYKGIQAAGGVYYYNGSEVVTTASELTDNYYWACYTIEFTSDTYKAADITAYIVVETENSDEVIESTPRTESFNNLKAEADKTLYIHTVEELKAFRDEVNAGTNYKGKIVALANDIDLTNENWTPIGAYKSEFQGTFDGNGYTVSNLKIDDLEVFGAGLFGYAINATFKNVNMHNVNIRADQEVGTICGSARTSTFDNIHVTGTLNLYADYAYAAGIVSQGYVNVSNCSVLPEGTGTITVREKTMAGGITAWLGEGNSSVTNCHVKNLDITAWTSVGSITGLLHYNNVMDNCSAENITLTKTRDGGFPAIGAACGNWVAKANGAEYLTKITNSSFKNIELNGGNSTITDEQQVCDFSSLYGAPYSGTTVDPFKVEIKNVTLEGITDNVDRGTGVKNTVHIYTLDELKAFRDEVNSGVTYEGRTIVLANDIDLANEDWAPIGLGEYFMGTFDGNGNTIKNLKVDAIGDEVDWSVGLFGIANKATIKNLNIVNADVKAYQQAGTVCGWALESTFDNIHVSGDINVAATEAYAGGLVSDGSANISNCSVIADEVGTIKVANKTTAGGIISNLSTGYSVVNCEAKNLEISAWATVGALVGQLYFSTTIDNCSAENIKLTKTRVDGLPSIGLACGSWVDTTSNPLTKITNSTFKNVELNGSAVIADKYAECDMTTLYGAPYGGATIKFNVDLTNTTYENVNDNVERSINDIFIRTAEDLKAFRDSVNEGNTYAGKVVKLLNNIDLNNENWTPIGLTGDAAGFQGTFDGNNKTIFNLKVEQATPAYQSAGLFGSARNGVIKNFTIENAYISSTTTGSATSCGTAVVVGSAQFPLTIENVDVKNAEVYSNRYAAVICGYFNGTITNCDVTNVKVVATPDNYTGSYDNGDKVGGIVGYINGSTSNISNNTIDSFEIKAYRDLGGIVGAGHASNLMNNKATNGSVTSDQTLNNYGAKTPNNNPILGRNLGSTVLDASNISENVVTEAK